VSTVQSVERTFTILEALAREPAGVSRLASVTDLPKSTVARLLATLEARQAVERSPDDPRYRLGPAIAELAASVTSSRNLIAVARPHLADLTDDVGEASGLSVADGYDVHYVDQVEGPNPVQVRDWTGSRIPMHAVPSGIVFLSGWPAARITRYAARDLERFNPNTVVDAAGITSKLAEAREAGHAWGQEEYAEGINSVAAGVRDQAGAVAAAVHVHGTAYRFPAAPDTVASRVEETAARISEQLGHR
jgi:DNA-binding IclR family transcriptional regulator